MNASLRPAWFAVSLVLGSGCLGFNTENGHPNNIVVHDAFAFASVAGEGFAVYDATTGARLSTAPIADGTCRVDDVAVDGALLFALDGTDGHLTTWSIEDPMRPALVDGPVEVDVGPFSGVTARAGVVIVSGGTSDLTVRSYDDDGVLSGERARLDLDRGQPDVVLTDDGALALVSTHFGDDVDGAEFGVTTLRIDSDAAVSIAGRAGLEGAGFTGGTANPANFPIEAAVVDRIAFVAHGGGLTVFDLTEDTPTIVGHLELAIEATSVDVADDRAYVVGIDPAPTLVVVDVADRTSPTVLRSVELDADALPTGVAVGAREVLIAANGAGVLVEAR